MSPFSKDNDIYATFKATILPNGDLNIIKVMYTGSESSGVLVLVITSVFSLVAVTGLLAAIAVSAWNTRKSTSPNLFVRTNVAPYFVLFLLADLLQAFGSLMNSKWVQNDAVELGGFCTTQGIIKHVSDISVAIWALVIATHTFLLLFYRVRMPRWVMFATIGGVLTLIFVITPLGPIIYSNSNRGNFYGIAGYWCWITDEYDTARITMDYMIMFISAGLSFILYSLVFLRMRGNIVVQGWYMRFRFAKNEDWRGRDFAGDSAVAIARQMLLYPIAYTIIILPIAAARFSEWAGHPVPFNVTIFCDTVFLLSGVVNVTLFYTTRRLLPAQSVFPSWRKFLPAKWVSQSTKKSRFDTAEKSFACRAAAHGGDLEKSVDTLAQQEDDDSIYMPSAAQMTSRSTRFKIDNHVDNTLTIQSQEDDNISRSSMAYSFETAVARPEPAVLVNTRAVDPFATVSSRGSTTSSIFTDETVADSEVLGHERKSSSAER